MFQLVACLCEIACSRFDISTFVLLVLCGTPARTAICVFYLFATFGDTFLCVVGSTQKPYGKAHYTLTCFHVCEAASQQKEEVNALIESKVLYQDDQDTKKVSVKTELDKGIKGHKGCRLLEDLVRLGIASSFSLP